MLCPPTHTHFVLCPVLIMRSALTALETQMFRQKLKCSKTGQRQSEREIKGGKALKIQTVRWRQTPTRMTHWERSLHKAWRFYFQNVWGGILWTVEVPESIAKHHAPNSLYFTLLFGQKGTLVLLFWFYHLRQWDVLLTIQFFSSFCWSLLFIDVLFLLYIQMYSRLRFED